MASVSYIDERKEMNLKPKYQKQYYELGLPWFNDQSEGIWSEGKEFNVPLFTPETDSSEVIEFAAEAANEHFQLKQAVETLRDCCVIACTRIASLSVLFGVLSPD
jgi:hypothetical protein